jgi:hypothetical protein
MPCDNFTMKRLLFTLSAIAIASMGTLAAANPASAANKPDPKKTYIVNCQGGLDFKPNQIVLACGDAGVYFADVTWSRWTINGARGVGTLTVNTCEPTCSAGNVETYKNVRLRLGGDASGPGFGTFVNTFTSLTGVFQGNGPALAQSSTWTLGNAIKE